MLSVVEHILSTTLRAAAGPDAWAWLEGAMARPVERSSQPLLDAYTRAPQRVGRTLLAVPEDQLSQLHAAAPGVGFALWTRDDAARALLLIAARRHGSSGQAFADLAL